MIQLNYPIALRTAMQIGPCKSLASTLDNTAVPLRTVDVGATSLCLAKVYGVDIVRVHDLIVQARISLTEFRRIVKSFRAE